MGEDPLPPGQAWVVSPGSMDEGPGLYRIEVNVGPGSGVKILNRPAPGPFVESMKYAEGNLYARARELVGDRDPRAHEFSVQLRAFDATRTGTSLGLGALLALCTALLGKSLKGGLIIVGGLNLGGTIDPVYNAVGLAELAVEKGASILLMPVSSRKQLFDLSDDMATKSGPAFDGASVSAQRTCCSKSVARSVSSGNSVRRKRAMRLPGCRISSVADTMYVMSPGYSRHHGDLTDGNDMDTLLLVGPY